MSYQWYQRLQEELLFNAGEICVEAQNFGLNFQTIEAEIQKKFLAKRSISNQGLIICQKKNSDKFFISEYTNISPQVDWW